MNNFELDNLVKKFQEKKLLDLFIYWGQNSVSRNGGFVYDENQMTWSSIYGKNGSGPYSQKEGETWSINTGYCPDNNFNDNDW